MSALKLQISSSVGEIASAFSPDFFLRFSRNLSGRLHNASLTVMEAA